MFVKFDKPSCLKHNLPFQYLCTNYNCQCTARLCLKCAQEHQNKQDIRGEFIKQDAYGIKLQIEIQVIAKHHANLQSYKDNSIKPGLLSSKNQENIQSVSTILLALYNDKKNICANLQNFNIRHYDIKKKLNKIKSMSNLKYLVNIRNKQLIPMLANLSSESGLQKLRKKVAEAQHSIQFYYDFMDQVSRYGTNTQQLLTGLGYKYQNLLIYKVLYCLSKWKNTRKVEVIDNAIRQNRENSNASRKKEKPPKKINLVSAHQRKRSNDKQNSFLK